MKAKLTAPYFEIVAACTNPACDARTINVSRTRATYRPTSGGPERAKSKIVCPHCRRWADIIDIRKVTGAE